MNFLFPTTAYAASLFIYSFNSQTTTSTFDDQRRSRIRNTSIANIHNAHRSFVVHLRNLSQSFYDILSTSLGNLHARLQLRTLTYDNISSHGHVNTNNHKHESKFKLQSALTSTPLPLVAPAELLLQFVHVFVQDDQFWIIRTSSNWTFSGNYDGESREYQPVTSEPVDFDRWRQVPALVKLLRGRKRVEKPEGWIGRRMNNEVELFDDEVVSKDETTNEVMGDSGR